MPRYKMRSIRRSWSKAKQDATPAQFRDMLPRVSKESLKVAIYAGKRMGEHLFGVKTKKEWSVAQLDSTQVEAWRRKFCVPKNMTAVMKSVAWSTLRNQKLDHKFLEGIAHEN